VLVIGSSTPHSKVHQLDGKYRRTYHKGTKGTASVLRAFGGNHYPYRLGGGDSLS
jgi:hypothetical protein